MVRSGRRLRYGSGLVGRVDAANVTYQEREMMQAVERRPWETVPGEKPKAKRKAKSKKD